ncbi:hypothetical protein ACERK3_17305 [Phycisphaerales bacterium AB-hyl4]|uniref:Uncharacterized protein n=1 Tax=Natronomicrosphaera hydrolytica TaxID=3242702 RepID=A0ABV4UC21_9BACT
MDRVYEAAERLAAAQQEDLLDIEPTPGEELERARVNLERWYERHDNAITGIEREAAWQRITQLTNRIKQLDEQVANSPPEAPPENDHPLCITREQVAHHLASLATLANNSEDQGKHLITSLINHHGLTVTLTSEHPAQE